MRKAATASTARILLRRPVGKKRKRNRDQAAHEVGVAVPAIVQDFFALRARSRLAVQPHLADATAYFVGVVVGLGAQGFERMTQFDDVAVPILPLIERGEIIADDVNCRQRMREARCTVHNPYMGAGQSSTSTLFARSSAWTADQVGSLANHTVSKPLALKRSPEVKRKP